MIATIGLPGGRIFRWCHVKNAKDAAEYRAAWLREKGESQETLQAVRDGLLLTEKEGRRARYLDGSRIYVDRM